MRHRLFAAYLTATIAAGVAYVLVASVEAKSVLIVALGFAATVAIVWGVRTYRPDGAVGWLLIGLMQLIWAVGWIFWQLVILDGAAPAVDSWQNILFLASNPLLTVALALLLRRMDPDPVAFIDAGIIAAAALTVVWPTLGDAYLEAEDVSALGKAVQLSYAVNDVLVLALALRIATAGRRLTPARALIAVAAAGLFFSDAFWNWSTQLENYAPGSWADAGWVTMHVAAGAAALHPSMRTAYSSEERIERRLRWSRLLPLAAAALVAPLVLSEMDPVLGHLHLIPAAIAGAVLTLLILLRMVLILREEERLAGRLRRQNEELLELDRLKDDFVASVSHELRTPLTSIRGYLELVLDGEAGEINAEQRQFLSVVDRNADRLLRVVSDLLFVAQVDAGKLTLELGDVDVARIATDTAEAARPAAETKRIDLDLDPQETPVVRGDRARLAQLLDNLVSNAIKFTPEGGRIAVRTYADDAAAVVEVADTGIGIDEAEQAQLFDRFFRATQATERAIQGTGLGLAIAKAIVDAHDGTISVTSAVGKGTTFRVDLPLRERVDAPELAAAR